MSCAKWESDIALYAGGDLPPNRLACVVAHLEVCDECRALADDLRAGQALLSELRDEPLEDAMAAMVRQRVLARLPVQRASATRGYWKWALAAGVILAAILLFPRHTNKQAPLARSQPAPPPVAAVPLAVVNMQRKVVPHRHHKPAPRATPQPGEPLLVQFVTNDPNIVIYWLVDPKPQGD